MIGAERVLEVDGSWESPTQNWELDAIAGRLSCLSGSHSGPLGGIQGHRARASCRIKALDRRLMLVLLEYWQLE